MKRILVGVLLSLTLLLVGTTGVLASKPVSEEMVEAMGGVVLDYDGDEKADCWYVVTEFTVELEGYEPVGYILVDYYGLRVRGNGKIRYTKDRLGEEYWSSRDGLYYDTFEPWTYIDNFPP